MKYEKNSNILSSEGDISSTAEDLLKDAQINISDEKLYLHLCHTKHVDVSSAFAYIIRKAAGITAFDMGLAWMLNRDDNNILSHSGDYDSFSSFLTIDKNNRGDYNAETSKNKK